MQQRILKLDTYNRNKGKFGYIFVKIFRIYIRVNYSFGPYEISYLSSFSTKNPSRM